MIVFIGKFPQHIADSCKGLSRACAHIANGRRNLLDDGTSTPVGQGPLLIAGSLQMFGGGSSDVQSVRAALFVIQHS